MKKFVGIIVQIIIIVMLTLIIVLPKKEFSANENRFLEKFPTLSIKNIISGEYMASMTDYISDHFPFREELLGFKTKVFKILGMRRQNDVYYVKDYLVKEYEKPVNNEKIVRIVNRFIDNNQDVKYSFMLVPSNAYILLGKEGFNYDEGETLEYFKNNLKAEYIDVSETLKNNADKNIYYYTDHHWTTYGAYLAYLEYCKINNLRPLNYEFEEVTNDFYGTLYSKVLDNDVKLDTISKVADNTEYIVEYKDGTTNSLYNEKYLNERDKYSYFLDGNKSLMTITNPSVWDNEILIIKDSYANAFIPLITKHYSKIHVIDPRYYKEKISDYIKENDIQNVLFIYNVGTLDSDIGILTIN